MSSITIQDLKQFYQSLQISPLDPANSKDKQLYVPYLAQESNDPIEELKNRIMWSSGSINLLSGLRGNGKSTELRRLRHLLTQSADNYVVLFCDMDGYFNDHAPIEITDFLVSLMYALNQVLNDKYGQDFSKLSYTERFKELLKSQLQIPDSRLLGINITTLRDYNFRKNLQENLRPHVDKVIEQAQLFMANVRQFIVEQQPNAEVVLIVDSIEKIRGRGSDAKDVFESVEELFKYHGEQLKFDDWHLLYTVPPYLSALSLGDGHVLQLPSVHVFDKATGQPDPKGIGIMQEIISKRYVNWGSILSDKQLEKIILATGGDFRDYFRLIRTVLTKIPTVKKQLTLPIDDKIIESAKTDLLKDMLPIPQDEMQWLYKIHQSKTDELPKRDDIPCLVSFFDNNYIQNYRNGDDWYDIHPLLREKITDWCENSGVADAS